MFIYFDMCKPNQQTCLLSQQEFVKLGNLHGSRVEHKFCTVELVHKFVMQPKFVELEVELILAVERVLLIPSLNNDGAIGPKTNT